MNRTTTALACLAAFTAITATAAADELEDRMRKAFATAWTAAHDTKTDRDELVAKLYREAWPGQPAHP